MAKIENNDALNTKINSKEQKSPNFKYKSSDTYFDKLYKETNLILLFEEEFDNRNENEYDKDSFIAEYISFCDEYTINKAKPN